MTIGTIATYDPSRGTGTLICGTNGRFPFSSRDASLYPGDRVSFIPTGGIAGVYAVRVRRADASRSAA